MDWTWYLFRFDGRINRAKLWLAMPVILGGLTVLGAVIVAIQSLFGAPTPFSLGTKDIFKLVDPDVYRTLKPADLPRLLVKLLGVSLLLWVYFATSIKRLHDRDKSGWWMVPFFVVPGLYNQFEDRLPDSYFMMLPTLIVSALYVWGFVEMYCLRGSRKDQPVRRRSACTEAAARHAAALGPAERDRNDAAQGWPAAGLAC